MATRRMLATEAERDGYVSSVHEAMRLAPHEVTNGDAALAALVADGDRAALEKVFDEYAGAVKSVAARVLRDEGLAEDVVQDTFIQFWNAPERFQAGRGSLRTFLVTIAHRRAVDMVRSEVARSRREQQPPEPDHFDLEEQVWSRSLSETVRNALDGLSPGERDAIALAYFNGLSYVEVARRLGEPEGTVKSRIRIGMRKLAVSLAGVTR
ncbi:MAG TPA: sigma-70 family RNA polymerase sigma factor [Acidimicrobiia bacterium]